MIVIKMLIVVAFLLLALPLETLLRIIILAFGYKQKKCSNKEHLEALSWAFMWFEVISGLKINLNKTKLIPMGEVSNAKELARMVRCKVASLPSTYLSLPLGASLKSLPIWDVVGKRFQKRLVIWKRQYLSKGGRLTLIKSTLSSLPIYYMSLFIIPHKESLRLEKLQIDFLWGEGSSKESLIW